MANNNGKSGGIQPTSNGSSRYNGSSQTPRAPKVSLIFEAWSLGGANPRCTLLMVSPCKWLQWMPNHQSQSQTWVQWLEATEENGDSDTLAWMITHGTTRHRDGRFHLAMDEMPQKTCQRTKLPPKIGHWTWWENSEGPWTRHMECVRRVWTRNFPTSNPGWWWSQVERWRLPRCCCCAWLLLIA